MKINKCHFCNKLTYTPIHITDVKDDGTVEVMHSCQKCRPLWDKTEAKVNSEEPKPEKIDLSHIKTPEELLAFLSGQSPEASPPKPPCECGMNEGDFDEHGKFGCEKCYTHFHEKMKELVFPFHNATQHVGKRPKRSCFEKMMTDPVEKEKYLKLKYAKALELEEYEKCPAIKKELDDLRNQNPPSTSSGQ